MSIIELRDQLVEFCQPLLVQNGGGLKQIYTVFSPATPQGAQEIVQRFKESAPALVFAYPTEESVIREDMIGKQECRGDTVTTWPYWIISTDRGNQDAKAAFIYAQRAALKNALQGRHLLDLLLPSGNKAGFVAFMRAQVFEVAEMCAMHGTFRVTIYEKYTRPA